jgi:hypothetical protein
VDSVIEDREEWADSHGYEHYRCPVCGRGFYTDGDPRGECCADDDDDDDDDDDVPLDVP